MFLGLFYMISINILVVCVQGVLYERDKGRRHAIMVMSLICDVQSWSSMSKHLASNSFLLLHDVNVY